MARRTDHTREEISSLVLDAAETIVAAEGLRALTARRVAAAIGYSPGTLYNVYADLDALVTALNTRTLQRLGERLAATPTGDDPMANARRLLGDYLAFQRENALLWQANVEHAGRQDVRQSAAYDAELAAVFGHVARAIVPPGGGVTDAEAAIVVRVLWAGLEGIARVPENSVLLTDYGLTRDKLAENLVETYLAGWMGRG